MVVAGAVCFITGIAYYYFTTDLPEGNYKELGIHAKRRKSNLNGGSFKDACKDKRVWFLFFVYAACFGVELTINNVAALYFKDYFGLGIKTAGLVAGLFGLMNIFARTTGGIIGDKFGHRWGLKGRVRWLFIALFVEGIALIFFSRMTVLPIAIGTMVIFSLFVQMSEGATYSVVPFINKKALGSVSGIVGAGGNMGAVAAGFLFRSPDLTWPEALLILGGVVLCLSFFALLVRFSPAEEAVVKKEHDQALVDRQLIDEQHEREREEKRKKKRLLIPAPTFSKQVAAFDFLRAFLGCALAIKGIYFILNFQELEGLAGHVGAAQNLIAWFVIIAHIVGGLALAIGFVTRLFSALNLAVLVGALVFVHSGAGLFSQGQDLQLVMLTISCLLAFLWAGSGRLSFDYLMNPGRESRL